MIAPALAVFVFFAGSVAAVPAPMQSPRSADCREWRQCQQMALDAAERHEYETFHDLAWRTVQTGNPKDPALLYLLARAQALSGRSHDAFVMLQRLAEMGVSSDAATNEDFTLTRELPGWAELAAQFDRLQRPGASPAAASAPAVNSPSRSPSAPASPPVVPPPGPAAAGIVGTSATVPAPGARTPGFTTTPPAEAGRFSTAPFAVGGFAYDAVSRRFLFGDRLGRKLIVLGEGSNQPSDLVHGDSAGFREISAIEIDARRGDLWVATTGSGGGAATLHRLQLVSGRPLKAFPIDRLVEPATLVDLAVTPSGTVLVLDAASRQLFALRAGMTSLDDIVRIREDEPASVAASDRDGVAYVAHRDGISRIDLRARTASHVTVPKGMSLGRLQRIRWYRNALIGLAINADDTRNIVRLELNSSGTAVARATTLEAPVPGEAQTFVTISGTDLIYLESGSNTASNLAELIVRRVRLP
jgi:hypothetical protein